MNNKPVLAQFFATVIDGKIAGIGNALPPAELLDNQFALTPREFEFLHGVKSLEEAKSLVASIEAKIKANQDEKVYS